VERNGSCRDGAHQYLNRLTEIHDGFEMTSYENTNDGKDCIECPLAMSGRRQFTRDLFSALAGTLVLPAIAKAAMTSMSAVSAVARGPSTRSYPIPSSDGVQIDRDADVILVRWANAVYAFNLACPHQNTALRWIDASQHFQCPKHKSQYTPSGEFITGRATRGMDRLGVRREGATIVVDLDSFHRQDKDPTSWDAAVVRLS
jgi:nitrite reductase/ring-hydroxylating ferredoxin subunit